MPHKWGFGMAPPRLGVTARRDTAVALLSGHLAGVAGADVPRAELAEAISEVKGLFTRCWRCDQWDWFIVYTRLGSPTNRLSKACSRALDGWGRGLRSGDDEMAARGRSEFDNWGGTRWLKSWSEGPLPLEEGWGFIYVLSTRERPDLLKVGFTNRPVDQRVAEINQATGVLVPFGARKAWKVRNARSVERLVHAALADYRVRADREFFQLDGRDAMGIINTVVAEYRLEH